MILYDIINSVVAVTGALSIFAAIGSEKGSHLIASADRLLV